MKIINKEEGRKVAYAVDKTVLSIGGGELMADLQRYQRDFPVHLNICLNEYGMLNMGLAERYVAEVDIPAKVYTYMQDGVDENDAPRMRQEVTPLDMEDVVLTLWSMEGSTYAF